MTLHRGPKVPETPNGGAEGVKDKNAYVTKNNRLQQQPCRISLPNHFTHGQRSPPRCLACICTSRTVELIPGGKEGTKKKTEGHRVCVESEHLKVDAGLAEKVPSES